MLSNTIKEILFGSSSEIASPKGTRVQTMQFPSTGEDDVYRSVTFPAGDGFILYLIKRIEKAEKRILDLETKKK